MLGGSSVLNYMVRILKRIHYVTRQFSFSVSLLCHQLYLRGNAKDYDSWEEMGNPGELTI